MSNLNINQRQHLAEATPHRTNLGDLSTVGYELSTENLRFVAGGRMKILTYEFECVPGRCYAVGHPVTD